MAPCSKDELIRAGTCATNKIGKSRVHVLQYLSRYCTTSETKPTVGILCTELVARYGSTRLTRARWLHHEKRTVPKWRSFPNGRSPQWFDLWEKVNSALASTSWELTDLRVRVNGAFANTGTASKSGHRTSRSSSRGRGGGSSWRSVVEAAADVRLMILAQSRLLMYPRRVEKWQLGCFPGLWWTESIAYGRAEVFWDTGRCCHIACYCW